MKFLLTGGAIVLSTFSYVNGPRVFKQDKPQTEISVTEQQVSIGNPREFKTIEIPVVETTKPIEQPKTPNKTITEPKVIIKTITSCQGNEVNWKIPTDIKSVTVYYKNRSNEVLFSRSFGVDPNNIISLKVNK